MQQSHLMPQQPTCTPATGTASLADDNEAANVPYRQAAGLLRILANDARPDTQWALHHDGRHLEKHGKDHWKAVQRIGQHVKGSADAGLVLNGSSGAVALDAYEDAASPGSERSQLNASLSAPHYWSRCGVTESQKRLCRRAV